MMLPKDLGHVRWHIERFYCDLANTGMPPPLAL